jgi:hypothetical protein
MGYMQKFDESFLFYNICRSACFIPRHVFNVRLSPPSLSAPNNPRGRMVSQKFIVLRLVSKFPIYMILGKPKLYFKDARQDSDPL